MKTYKDFGKIYIGSSDIASITLRSPDGLGDIHFGGDGSYDAYLVTEPAEIGSHYTEEFRAHHWLWIYDDEKKTVEVIAPEIIVYRAGEMGCIIYAPNAKVGC